MSSENTGTANMESEVSRWFHTLQNNICGGGHLLVGAARLQRFLGGLDTWKA